MVINMPSAEKEVSRAVGGWRQTWAIAAMQREVVECLEGMGCCGRLLGGGRAGDNEEESSFPMEANLSSLSQGCTSGKLSWGRRREVYGVVSMVHQAGLTFNLQQNGDQMVAQEVYRVRG